MTYRLSFFFRFLGVLVFSIYVQFSDMSFMAEVVVELQDWKEAKNLPSYQNSYNQRWLKRHFFAEFTLQNWDMEDDCSKLILLFISDQGLNYRKIASSNTSRFEAHEGFFRLLMKGIFNPYALWPFDKVTRSRTCNYTVVKNILNKN